MKNISFGRDPATVERYLKRFADHGIAKKRIRIFPYAIDQHEHFAAYNEIDVMLDTFPYNGTTTICEALVMGVPVVALYGTTHAGRVGASLIRSSGSVGIVSHWVDSYVNAAKVVFRQGKITVDDRMKNRETVFTSALCDAEKFAGKFWNKLVSAYKTKAQANAVSAVAA
jgi:predicted O-linked N-acetylglucosamine transferase (SPINDLY family)